jgi:hypothetical protein
MRGFLSIDEMAWRANLQDQARCLPAFRRVRGTGHAAIALSSVAKEQSMRDSTGRKVETAVEARAGFLDRPVLVVLCASLALGILALGALWLGFT